MAKTTANSNKPTFLQWAIPQLIAFVVCVGAPGFLTAMVPVSWLKFERQVDQVTAQAKICVFFIIPYRTENVAPVVAVSDREKSGSTTRHRRTGTDKYVKAEDKGYLTIEGPDQAAEVLVSPHDLKSVVEKATSFLKDPQSTELKMYVVANWKFGVIAGGLLSLLTVIWVIGVSCSLFLMVLRPLGLAKPAQPRFRSGLP